ncbi:MAG: putative glycosyltransferase [Planctomycetota bacterium]|jgi:predicted glycosyltransferase
MNADAQQPSTNTQQAPLRVMTYSHDSVGLGHLRRSVTMASAMVARGPHVQALCLTGSLVPDLFPLPERCDVVKLPSIGKSASGEYVSRRLPISPHAMSTLRSDLITATVRSFHPDVLLVDHTANGPRDELLPVLRRLAHEGFQTRVVLGMRDVLDEPAMARRELDRNQTFDVVRRYYDQVLVYGDRDIFDPIVEYRFPADIAAKTAFTGPVVSPASHLARRPRAASESPSILVTPGGGEDGYELLRSTVAALRGPLRDADLRATIVAGPLLADASYQSLERAVCRDERIRLIRCSSDMHTLLSECDLVVGMGGYNTVYECLARGVPLVAVPRTQPRLEQWERCKRLAARGLLRVMTAAHAHDPHRMADVMLQELSSEHDRERRLECLGAEEAARLCLSVGRCRGQAMPAFLRSGS